MRIAKSLAPAAIVAGRGRTRATSVSGAAGSSSGVTRQAGALTPGGPEGTATGSPIKGRGDDSQAGAWSRGAPVSGATTVATDVRQDAGSSNPNVSSGAVGVEGSSGCCGAARARR